MAEGELDEVHETIVVVVEIVRGVSGIRGVAEVELPPGFKGGQRGGRAVVGKFAAGVGIPGRELDIDIDIAFENVQDCVLSDCGGRAATCASGPSLPITVSQR